MILSELQSELVLQGSGRTLSVSQRRGGSVVEYRGKVLIDFAHFDYLHLGESRELRKAVQQYLEADGLIPSVPRLLSGSTLPLESAERALSKFLGTERSFLFPSRTQAVLSTITAIANERDVFFIDELIQGPFSDAAYLVGAEVHSFSSLDALALNLERASGARRRFVVVETLSPMGGTVHDLSPFLALCKRFLAELIVDETYSLGIVGARGAGGGEALVLSTNEPLIRNVLLSIADLAFGVASTGAVVSGSSVVIESIVQRSKALGSDPPLPSFVGALIEKALEMVELAPLARAKIIQLATRLKQGLPHTSLLSTVGTLSPIISLQLPKLRKAQELATTLFQRGFLVDVLPRATPFSEAGVVRFVITSSHTEKQIEELLRLLSEILSKIDGS